MPLSVLKRFLFAMNPHTGHKAWWLMWFIGVILMVTWIIPTANLMIFNMQIFDVPPQYWDAYFLACFFGVVVCKFGLLMVQIGWNFARGYTFSCSPPGGILNGTWTQQASLPSR